jgi:probable selenium-dependent hydroxylase accessory protein YqeC
MGGRCVTLIGSGGKTSLMWALAAHYKKCDPACKILVSTTTKMGFPPPESGLYDLYLPEDAVTVKTAVSGITFTGRHKTGETKTASLPIETLEAMMPLYDHCILEGDGSRMLPVKAWAPYEPVVPASSSSVVGILPLHALGKPVSEQIIHRLPLFLERTGAAYGETLTMAHLVAIITDEENGMFSRTHGKKILFFNQVETEKDEEIAQQFVSLLPESFKKNLSLIISGSVKLNYATLHAP